jgi:transaldolase
MVGEKATISSQRQVTEVVAKSGKRTLQIAASMRSASQVRDLTGVDVYTMPLKVAQSAASDLDGTWTSRIDREYDITLSPGIDMEDEGLPVLWDVPQVLKDFARDLDGKVPQTGEELVERAHESGLGDIFPELSSEEESRIATDGKIPVRNNWKKRIEKHDVAVDSLLNLAGLASFAGDQGELDERIRGLID